MVKRICPVCDQVMKSSHYCSVCKRWVRRPYLTNTDYYMNESHPAGERRCEYHDPPVLKNGGNGAGEKRVQMSGSAPGVTRIIWMILIAMFLIDFLISLFGRIV